MSPNESFLDFKKVLMNGVLAKNRESYQEEIKKAGGENMPDFQLIGVARSEVYKVVGEFLEAKGITEEEFLRWLDEIRRRANQTFLTDKLGEIIDDQKLGE